MPAGLTLRRPPDHPDTYTVFVSSGDDVQELRGRIKRLTQLLSEQLHLAGSGVSLRPILWEDVVAQTGQTRLNEVFVELARSSHLTIVLLQCEVRPGTQEELEAVLEEGDIQVAVLRFIPDGGCESVDPVIEFLEDRKDDFVLYNSWGPAESDDGWFALARVLFSLVIALAPTFKGAYRDRL
jgi:hypothetical protein